MLLCTTVVVLALVAADPAREVETALAGGAKLSSYTFVIEDQPGQGMKGCEGKFQKGQPISFKADNIEFYRQEKAIVYLQGGSWKRSKTGVESDPLLILGAVAKVRRARLPHEELLDLGTALQDVKKTDQKGGSSLYSATLTARGIRQLVPTEYAGVARNGNVKLWLDADKKLHKYELSFRLQGRLGNAEIDGNYTHVVTLGNPGKTRVQVPAEAARLLRP